MKEIRRTVESNINSGMACGPVSMTAVVGEIVIEDAGKEKYLTMCWVDEADDALQFEITNSSIKKYLLDLDESVEAYESIVKNGFEICLDIDEEYSGEYTEQYYELMELVKNKCIEEELLSEDHLWMEEYLDEEY